MKTNRSIAIRMLSYTSLVGLTATFIVILVNNKIVDGFVNSPKIITKDGNLIFEAGFNRNISFRLSGKSRLNINNEYDLLDILLLVSNKKHLVGPKDEWSTAYEDNGGTLRQLSEDLTSLRLQALGRGGLDTRLRNILNRTRTASTLLRRYQTRLRFIENKVRHITTQLDRNDCQSNPCENGGSCFTTFNGFACKCRNGFEGTKCERDINECVLYGGTDLTCQNGAQCVNQFGTFSCICTPGWFGVHCTQQKGDCLQSSSWELCGHGTCVSSRDNVFGYKCLCKPGWQTNGLTPDCTVDVDECNADTRTHCSTKCINLPGSFTCAPCFVGMVGNGIICQDLDECALNNGGCSLSPQVKCINTLGSYHCAECPVGWLGDGHTCTHNSNIKNSGQTENNSMSAGGRGGGSSISCAQPDSICHPTAVCSEISNTVVCSCPAGMVGNGIGSNGCIRGTSNNCNDLPCMNGGTCFDVGNNYTCLCPMGFQPPKCQSIASPCQPNPCNNGARCRLAGGTQFICQCAPGFKDRLCNTRFNRCGGMLAGITGRLQYPPEGTGYEHNAQCAWVIRTNETSVLNVTFNAFQLEDATDCQFDWLQINDGRTVAAQLIGRFCGHQKPRGGNIISSTNELYLWFRSDKSTSKEGFDLVWNSIEPQCGGVIELITHGTIATPGSPGNYPKNRDCRWQLRAPNNKRIKLTFFSLQIENHEDCNSDYVDITDLISGNELHRFCSSAQPDPLLLPTNAAEVHFHSDDDGTDGGFQMHYAIEERVPGCGGSYTDSEGIINSPISVKGQELSCEYDIRMTYGESITIEFIKYDLAIDDCLEVYDIDSTRNSMDLQSKYCGGYYENPVFYQSLYNAVQIRFHTNGLGISNFLLKFKRECSFTYENNSGVITSPNYLNVANTDFNCTYKILTTPNTVIALNAIDFELKDSSNLSEDAVDDCIYTFLKIYDNVGRNLLGPYCGNVTPPLQFVSKSNMLILHFKTGSTTIGRGFKFSYKSVPIGKTDCGGIYTKPGQTIRLPTGDEGVYMNDVVCYWVIMAPIRKGILLNWKSFALESSLDCTYDYLEIYDSLANTEDGDDKMLGRFCDSHPPPNFMTHSRLLTIKFVSDFGGAADGFELTYDFIDTNHCGGVIYASTGCITTPDFPRNYTNDVDCSWVISGPLGTQIELQIEIFELEKSVDCSGDWLDIRNGGSNDSVLIGRYCDSGSIPSRLPSFTNQLRLDFHSDSFVNDRGFRISWSVYANGCGGNILSEKGVITSPQYPNPYPNNVECEWRVYVHKGSAINIVIEDLSLEDLFECLYDYVQFFEGRNTIGEPVAQICRLKDQNEPIRLSIDRNEATVIFRTDASTTNRGFRMSYYTNCFRTISDMNGVIESLNYGEFNYLRSINCSWTIQAPKSNRILIEFTHFEYMVASTTDNAAVYIVELMPDGIQRMHSITEAITTFFSTSDSVTILHNTSAITFRLEYRMDGCVFVEYRDSGKFQTPNYPKMYNNNLECLWEIRTEPGKGIELTVDDMDIEGSINCFKDALIISNHQIEYNNKERHCGVQSKVVITSSAHRLYVRFVSDDAHNGKGFTASYRTLNSPCGGVMASKNGIIQSPNYPQRYPPNTNCEWTIEVSVGHAIVFVLEELDIESGFLCIWDYLEATDVYNTTEENNKEENLFKICGDDLTITTWKTTSNVATLRFISDDSNQGHGFKLHYHEACGQRLYIDEEDYAYLEFKRYTPVNETCTWHLIETDLNKHVLLTPTNVQLYPEAASQYPNEENCLEHGIKVFDGTDTTGRPRSKFCLSHPPAVISKSHALTITIPANIIMDFKVHHMTVDSLCGGVAYKALSGKFTSPYYPDSYPVNIVCYWYIIASSGNSITLTFESMDLEQSDECNNDYIEVREDSYSGRLLGVYCGKTDPPVIKGKGTLFITFKSNDVIVGQGFMASYNYEKHNEIYGSNGTIQSPSYPSKLHVTEPFSWRITVDKDYAIVLNIKHITDIDIPYIKFYDGYSDIGIEINYAETYIVRSNTNYLYFTASRGPFEIEWEQISKDALRSNQSTEERTKICGKQILTVNNTIVFNSPGYPHGYAENLQCSWTFTALNPATHVTFQFIKIDLESFVDCFADYVRVSASSDLHLWQQLDKLCENPNTTIAKTYHGKPYLKLDFITDSGVNRTGFSSYVRTECGSELTERRGFVNITKLVTLSTMFQMECIWTVRVRSGRRIRITFLESQIRDPNDSGSSSKINAAITCRSYFMTRNGIAEDSPFLGSGKYCENNITDVLETTSNHAYIKFKHLGYLKFRAAFLYEEISHECSDEILLTEDTYNGSSRIITSPNYPNLANPHSECIWKISAPPHHVISVHFLGQFDLTPGPTAITEACNQEYVQINDGLTELMPLIGRYCGKNKPDSIYSTNNVLRLKYFNDVSEPRLGFKAQVTLGLCGGTYYSNEGTFSTPNQLIIRTKEHSFECVYTIEVEKGNAISINITSLKLPESSDCSEKPHLELQEIDAFGDYGEEKITDIVILCGSAPRSYLVETNKIVIRWKLLGQTPATGEGFKLSYRAMGARCGETIVALQGVLQTPGYPGGVQTPTHCSWQLKVPKGRSIKVEVLDFDTGPSNGTRSLRGRLMFANDFKMQSIIGRYTNNPPPAIYSTDNTMAIDSFLLPFSRHRGFKLRFSAYGFSECSSLYGLQSGVDTTLNFRRTNDSNLHCAYDLSVAENETLVLNILKHVSRVSMMSSPFVCIMESPIKLELNGVQLLPRLLCENDTANAARIIRLPFPTHMEISGSKRNELEELILDYRTYKCGGIKILDLDDSVTIIQPLMDESFGNGKLECAWAVWPHLFTEDNMNELSYLMDGVQIEVSLSVDFQGNCTDQYLLLYNGPNQNAPHLGRYCNQAMLTSNVIERGLFFEYHTSSYEKNSTFILTIKHGSGCGGKVNYPYRKIYFDEQYKNNVECIWVIETEPGFHIGLSFEDRFFIELSTGCIKDYIKVQQRSSDDEDWVNIGTFCGREPPATVNTTTTSMRVIFRSDNDTIGDGFIAKFERNCGGILYATVKALTFASPGYPVQYEKNLMCNYTILPKDDSSAGVLVRFLDFDLEQPPINKCIFDNVTVRTTNERSVIQESVICGVKKKHEYRGKKSISIVLRTDYSFSGKGFLLEYTTNLCGGVITKSTSIESPRQHTDNTFPPSSNCFWNLTGPIGSKIVIKFEEINFENQITCRYDAVEVYQGLFPLEQQRLAVFCGNLTGKLPTLSIPTHEGLIHSFSDEHDASLGFKALIKFLHNCEERIYLGFENLTYNFNKYAESYPDNLDCSYIFTTTPNHQLQIEFNSFHVEATLSCQGDYLEIRDGAGLFADVIGMFCGYQKPNMKLLSSRNFLFIRFVTDSSTHETGFSAMITAIPLLCGRHNIQLDENTTSYILNFTHVADNGKFKSDINCYWKIVSNKNIHLQFNHFELGSPSNNGPCELEYLKIYNKEDAKLVENGYGSEIIFNGQLSGVDYSNFATEHVYCGKGIPDDYYANSKEVYLKFRSNNGGGEKSGFILTAKQNNGCFRNFTSLQGRIKIADTSDHCDIYIKTPTNYTISIYYADLTFAEYDCNEEYVEVFDQHTNKSLQKVCSYMEAGKSLFSNTNELRLRIKMKDYYTEFDMTYVASNNGTGCGGELYNTAGIIVSAFYPNNVRNNADCRWSIRVPDNNQVLLRFDEFNLGAKSTCHSDYLQIIERSEHNGSEKVMRQFCGGDTPKIYKSSRSQLTVRFHKTVNYDGTGWVLKFYSVYENYVLPGF